MYGFILNLNLNLSSTSINRKNHLVNKNYISKKILNRNWSLYSEIYIINCDYIKKNRKKMKQRNLFKSRSILILIKEF